MEAVLRLGCGMETLIFELADKHFFFGDLEVNFNFAFVFILYFIRRKL